MNVEVTAIFIAVISFFGTVIGVTASYRAQAKNTKVNEALESRSLEAAAAAVAAELYDELTKNQASRIAHLETREKEMEDRLRIVTTELQESSTMLHECLKELDVTNRLLKDVQQELDHLKNEEIEDQIQEEIQEENQPEGNE